jgi:geranylgeranyl diphosphate synthase type I
LPKEKLWDQVNILLNAYGKDALLYSKNFALEEQIDYKPLREALEYFFESWFDILHPALISLSCEAVGGDKNQTVKFGAAVVLLAAGADIHDDIIDHSTCKGQNLTVFGKFGQDLAILAGDALILKGTYLLHEACEPYTNSQRQRILESIKNTFFEICSGVAKETELRGSTSFSLEEFLSIVERKVAAVEATMMIGALIGGGSDQQIAVLSHYGRIYGMLLSLRDEFVDVFEADEITNRLKNECLPLPIVLALQEDSKNQLLSDYLKKEITDENLEKIVDLSFDCKASRELVARMKNMINETVDSLFIIERHKDAFSLLLNATIEDL